MKHIGDDKCIGNDISGKVVRIEAKIEVDVGG